MAIDTIRRLGLHRDLGDDRDLHFSPIMELHRLDAPPLPPSVNLISGCPDVYDQGDLGSCGPNAGCGAFEYDLKRQGLGDFLPSRLYVYYEARPRSMKAVDSGTTIRSVAKALATYGVPHETEWPYDISQFTMQPTPSVVADALKNKALLYRRIPQNLPQMKAALRLGYTPLFGISVYQSFMEATNGIIPLPMTRKGDKPLGEGHALMLVGYDDAKKVFLIRNSWGANWGNKGYGTIPYDYLISNNAFDFWVINLVEKDNSTTSGII